MRSMCLTKEKDPVEYFKELIKSSCSPVTIPYIHCQIEKYAPKNIQKLICQKYSGDNLYDFFAEHADVFTVSELGFVSLINPGLKQNKCQFKTRYRDLEIEDKIEKYFEDILKSRYSGTVDHVSGLYKHIDSASDDIINYLNTMYSGETFELLFYRFPNTFHVSKTLSLSLKTVQRNQRSHHQPESKSFLSSENGLEEEAVEYFKQILLNYPSEPIPYKFLHCRLAQAKIDVRSYMLKKYPISEFLSFFDDNKEIFRVDSKSNVSLQDIKKYPVVEGSHLSMASLRITQEILQSHQQTSSSSTENSLEIKDTLQSPQQLQPFSPTETSLEIKDTLQSPQQLQSFSSTGTSLEKEAVNYFKNILLTNYSEPEPYKYLYCHLSHVSIDVHNYMIKKYPFNEFLSFFKNNKKVFRVDPVGNVSLKKIKTYPVVEDTHKYLIQILRSEYPNEQVHFTQLRKYLKQAPEEVMDFIEDCYPGDDFLVFLRLYPQIYKVNKSKNVTLK